jgi:hypothetical protein
VAGDACPGAATVPGLSQAHVMVVKLSKEREGYGVGVLGESYAFAAILRAFPFVDHHADTLSLRLVLGVRCEHAGINGSGRSHRPPMKRKPEQRKGG